MDNVKKTYTTFHKTKFSKHNYPTEWVIRTFLGSYPELVIDKSRYVEGRVLDLGFGDGRNIQLLANCGLKVSGIEVTQEICDAVKEMLLMKNIDADLKVGTNTAIPFPDNYFDFILASSSCYYVDAGYTFTQNINEIVRTLNVGGYLVANFPLFAEIQNIKESFILENCEFLNDGHVRIRNDIYGIRNGYTFKAFNNDTELKKELSPFFDEIYSSNCYDNYYGVQINSLICVARKRRA